MVFGTKGSRSASCSSACSTTVQINSRVKEKWRTMNFTCLQLFSAGLYGLAAVAKTCSRGILAWLRIRTRTLEEQTVVCRSRKICASESESYLKVWSHNHSNPLYVDKPVDQPNFLSKIPTSHLIFKIITMPCSISAFFNISRISSLPSHNGDQYI